MARFRNVESGSEVSVDDSKADRFKSGWVRIDEKPSKRPNQSKKSK